MTTPILARKLVVSAFVAVVLGVSTGCAVEGGLASSRQRLDGAPPDETHGYAIGICDDDSGNCTEESGLCSGSLIAPNLVMTARHCVDRGRAVGTTVCETQFLGIIDATKLRVTAHAAPFDDGATPIWRTAREVLVPDDLSLCGSDIALVILEENVPPAEATPADVDVFTDLAVTPLEEIAIVGRGILKATPTDLGNGTIYPGTLDSGGHRRRILEHIPVVCASNQAGVCKQPDSAEPTGAFSLHVNHVLAGRAVLPGDSGAGMVAQESLAGPTQVVVAVVSLGGYEVDGPTSSIGIRASVHRDFLVAGAVRAAELGAYPVPTWVGDVPEPPEEMPPAEMPPEEMPPAETPPPDEATPDDAGDDPPDTAGEGCHVGGASAPSRSVWLARLWIACLVACVVRSRFVRARALRR